MAMRQVEGPWEDIAARAGEFAGRRVRLTVLQDAERTDAAAAANCRMLAFLEEWERTPLTFEEEEVLEGFEEFQRQHPVALGDLRPAR